MCDHFTNNARKVLELAHQESRRFETGYCGTEHLLLALIGVANTSASGVLTRLKAHLDRIRRAIEELPQQSPGDLLKHSGITLNESEIELLAKLNRDRIASGELPQTPRLRNVLAYAEEEARSLGQDYVGTEHILLGLLREKIAPAVQVLMNEGLSLESARTEILAMLARRKRKGT